MKETKHEHKCRDDSEIEVKINLQQTEIMTETKYEHKCWDESKTETKTSSSQTEAMTEIKTWTWVSKW